MRSTKRRWIKLAAVLFVLSGVLLPVNAPPASASTLSCEFAQADGVVTVSWSGVPADTTRVVVERRVDNEWHWRGSTDTSVHSFADDPGPVNTRYRVLARGVWPTALERFDCIPSDTNLGLDCVATKTIDGYRLTWSSTIGPAHFIVRRQVADDGQFYWRGGARNATAFEDTSSWTGQATYRIEARLVPSGQVAGAADCRSESDPGLACPPVPIGNADQRITYVDYDGSPLIGGDGAVYFSGENRADRSSLGLYRVEASSNAIEHLPVPGHPLSSIEDVIIGPDGHVYFFAYDSGKGMYRYNTTTAQIEPLSLAPAYGWSYGDKVLGDDGRIYWPARFGGFPSQNYGVLAYDPATNSTERIVENLGGPINHLVAAPDRIYYGWAAILERGSIDDILGPWLVRYIDLNTGETAPANVDPGTWRYHQWKIATSDGRLFLGPGLRGAYDPSSDVTIASPNLQRAQLASNGKIYGRRIDDNQVSRAAQYDPGTGELIEFEVPDGVFPFAVTWVDGAVYFLNQRHTQDLYRIDLESGVTTKIANLDVGSFPNIAGGADGRVYLFASDDGGSKRLMAIDPSCWS